jgi:hypothetical protein
MNNEKLNGNKFLTLLGGCFAALGALFVFFIFFIYLIGKISK